MDNINNVLKFELIGNTIEQYCWCVGILLAGIIFKRLMSKIFSRLLFRLFKKYSENISINNFLALLQKPICWLIMMIVLYIAFSQLNYPAYWKLLPSNVFGLKMIIEKSYLIFFLSSILYVFIRIVDFFGLIILKRTDKTENKSDNHIVPFITGTTKITIIILGIFVMLGNVFNINIGSLIAGLGIGGLAIALAAKDTLENFFGSFTIFLDKPFAVGDNVKVGNIIGTVEKIGFRSTRLRTLDKTFVSIPNKKMIDVELDNISLRTCQRANFTICLQQDTQTEKIKLICNEIEECINNHPLTNQNTQVKFIEIGKNSLDIMIMYYVDSVDWSIFIAVKEEINYKIITIVKKHNVHLAMNN